MSFRTSDACASASTQGAANHRTDRPRSSRASVVQLVLAGVLWGTGGITGQLLAAATGLTGPAVAAYRLGLGGLVLVASCLVRRVRMPRDRRAWGHVALLGVLAAVFQAAYFSALRVGSVSVSTLVAIGSAPLVVLVVDRLRGAPTTRAQVRAAALGICGLALLVGAPEGGQSTSAVLACVALATIAGSAFAGFTMAGRAAPAGLDSQAAVGLAFLVGGGLLTVGVSVSAGMGMTLEARSIGLLAVLVLLPTGLAYSLFFRGLQGASAATAVVIALLEPTTATILSVVLLHETITVIGLLGAALLLVSVADAARAEGSAARTTPPAG